jgi:asparagine synthase (glutamine-hydrolysing)
MCGIAGIWTIHGALDGNLEAAASKMAFALAHRGPDGQGVWVHSKQSVAFGHRRLATLDLTSAGAQPMTSHCGRYVIVYNGELYHFSAVRDQLQAKGIEFSGSSDTEVLLEAISAFGVEEALTKLDGMFAFGVFDLAHNKMTIARDRFGIKPLYVYYDGNICAFSSELKAFKALPQLQLTLNQDAVSCYQSFGFVPYPLSIYENVIQLCPGEMLEVTKKGIEKKRYWEAAGLAKAPKMRDSQLAQLLVEEALEKSVQNMLQADVPVGVFLSGGIDSTLVAALAGKTHKGIQAFTLGFSGVYDESTLAAQTAGHLGLHHATLQAGPKDILETVLELPYMYDEPFADASQIPTFLLSRLAKETVTVALSGDGADEAFGGYERHRIISQILKWKKYVPESVMRSLLSIISNVACHDVWPDLGHKFLREKIHKVERVLGANNLGGAYFSLLNQTGLNWPGNVWGCFSTQPEGTCSDLRALMAMDSQFYLPSVLTKVDRASMANSLEVRVPFLDLYVQEIASQLDDSLLIARGKGKVILRQLAQKYAPHVAKLPKAGFTVPLGQWLRGPLREVAESYMVPGQLEPLFGDGGPHFVKAWQACRAGDDRQAQSVWIGLMGVMWSTKWLT